jgi:hypothetical protein
MAMAVLHTNAEIAVSTTSAGVENPVIKIDTDTEPDPSRAAVVPFHNTTALFKN